MFTKILDKFMKKPSESKSEFESIMETSTNIIQKPSKISTKGLDLLKQFEGLRLKPYLCSANVPTIGYGSTRYKDDTKVTMQDKAITKEQAEELLRDTLAQYEQAVIANVKAELKQQQFDALVCFVYNVGVGNFKASTLLKVLNQKKYTEAGDQFLRWNKANGIEVAGLTKRRAAERTLFLS